MCSEASDSIDYYFMYGPALDNVIAAYRHLNGAAPMFGRWAWGFWQCKNRYQTQQELLDVVSRYRSQHIPIDGIIQDGRGSRVSVLKAAGDWQILAVNELDDECFATPAIAGGRIYIRTRSVLYCFGK
jgi:alpha-glucosidase (family GH31 glycosyl hydrolase)